MADDIDSQIKKSLGRVDSELRAHRPVDKILTEINADMRQNHDADSAAQYLRQLTDGIHQRGQFPQLTQAYLKANFDAFDLDRDGYIGTGELRQILDNKLLGAATTPFEKQIVRYAQTNFKAIAEASKDEWGGQTRISKKDLDTFPAVFARSSERQVKSQDMVAAFGTPDLFAKLNATSTTAFSHMPLVSEGDLKKALASRSGSFTEAERQTIKFMLDNRAEIARASNDQYGSETKISLKDVQAYASLHKPDQLPRAMANVSTPVDGPIPARSEVPSTASPSTQEICRFVEKNFGSLDIDGDRYITKKEVDRMLTVPRWANALSPTDKRTLEAFSGLVDTMQKAHRDEKFWYKDTHGVTLKDVQEYSRQDNFNHRDLPKTPGDHQVKLMIDGKEREVLVHIPPGYDSAKSVSSDKTNKPQVWISLHPLFGDQQEMVEWTNMTRKADQVGAVVMYPNAKGWLPDWSPLHLRQWSLNNKPTNVTDDVAFVKTIMDVAQQQFGVERSCVVGYSNGGMLAHEVAARMPERVAAVAVVSSSQCGELPQPKAPVSVLTMNGTSDPLVPWRGRTYPSTVGFGRLKSVDDTTRFWYAADGVTSVSRPVEAYPGVQRTVAINPQTGNQVIQYKMDSGHCWPGARSAMFGRLCQTMNATDVIADFFAKPSASIR